MNATMVYTTRTTDIFLAAVVLIVVGVALYRIVRARRAAARAQRPIGVALTSAKRGEVVTVAIRGTDNTVWPDKEGRPHQAGRKGW